MVIKFRDFQFSVSGIWYLFASRLNKKVETFCSWEPEPGAAFVNAFMVDWRQFKLPYIFCPFSVVPQVLQHLDRWAPSVVKIKVGLFLLLSENPKN